MQKKETMMKSQSTGVVIAAITHSRRVRPRDIRARKTPTNDRAKQNAEPYWLATEIASQQTQPTGLAPHL